MGWIHIEYKDIDTIEWEKIEQFELCEIFKKSEGKVVQIYPYNLLKAHTSIEELKEYDRKGDKRYFCTDFHDNGFTPKNTIGTCRTGTFRYFLEVVKSILKCQSKFDRR